MTTDAQRLTDEAIADSMLQALLDAQTEVWPDAPKSPPTWNDDNLDFRVCTNDGGDSFFLRTGDVQYDTDGAGLGAGSITGDMEACELQDALMTAIDDAREVLAQDAIDDEEPEPQPEDYTISPCGTLGGRYSVGQIEGPHVGEYDTQEQAEDAIRKHAGKHFRPDVWNVSDHGNFHLMTFDW